MCLLKKLSKKEDGTEASTEKDAFAGLNAPLSVFVVDSSFSHLVRCSGLPLTMCLCPRPHSCARSWRRSRCSTSSWTISSCVVRSTRESSSTLFTASRLTVETSSTSSSCRRSSRLKGNSSKSARTWSWLRWQLWISIYLPLVFCRSLKMIYFYQYELAPCPGAIGRDRK